MRHAIFAAAFAAAAGMSGAAYAQPPADAKPLSEIISSLEAQDGFGHIEDVEWDSAGYWEIEYRRTDGSKIEVDVDPVSGEARR
jgi:hypothetical protein